MSLVRFRPEAPSEQSPGKFLLSRQHASVAHLVERHLAKVEVASSSLVTRSNFLEHFCSRWCHSQVVRQSSAKAPLPSSNLGGTSKKKDTLKSVSFFLGFDGSRPPPPFGDSNARGRQSRPCAILRSEFTPHSRRGPEGPFESLAAKSKMFRQSTKQPHH